MAVIHDTTLEPSKLDLLTSWLPSRPWYRGGAAEPELTKAGGFRLDDPRGEVGIEFIVATDTGGPRPTTYLVPLTYRGAPLEGAEQALVGTMEHGVLGRRWAYDGCRDAVLIGQLAALIEGRAQAQDQNLSDVPDREVVVTGTGDGSLPTDFIAADDQEGTTLTTPQGTALRVHRVLRPAPAGSTPPAQGAIGQVSGSWQMPDGTRARGVFAVLRGAGRA
ncbi:1,4-alpha-glucan branching protein [Streptomyces sp. 378]|uniref:maltokinase N-terminal cap-like domain-containing protein n=1 Tax=Streptomyces sp. 378 TaxID=3049412 RepID=UPI0024C24525|nr:1,4-alpha-glucan branching protein [Streptomyces sp. 378]MDK1344525.1 1,4-alpha-glucan branching protein [Streptomyces sp. 378]